MLITILAWLTLASGIVSVSAAGAMAIGSGTRNIEAIGKCSMGLFAISAIGLAAGVVVLW